MLNYQRVRYEDKNNVANHLKSPKTQGNDLQILSTSTYVGYPGFSTSNHVGLQEGNETKIAGI